MPPLPAPIEDFRVALADLRPQHTLKAEPPFHAGTPWWLDVEGLPLVHRPDRGFGLFAPEGEDPSVWIVEPAEAAHAVAARLPCRLAA